MKAKEIATMIIASMTWTLTLTAPVAAQQPAREGEQKSQSQPHREKMSMDDMMKECRTHCQETTTSIDQLTKRMDEAKQSNDPAQMRAALDAAQQPLTEMKDHMTKCMHMMSMMQGMHGGRGGHMMGEGGHMGGMMHGEGSKSGTETH